MHCMWFPQYSSAEEWPYSHLKTAFVSLCQHHFSPSTHSDVHYMIMQSPFLFTASTWEKLLWPLVIFTPMASFTGKRCLLSHYIPCSVAHYTFFFMEVHSVVSLWSICTSLKFVAGTNSPQQHHNVQTLIMSLCFSRPHTKGELGLRNALCRLEV